MGAKPNVSTALAAALLKDWKEELKISIEELAVAAGLREAVVRELIAGSRVPEMDELAALSHALNRSLKDLLPVESDLHDGLKVLAHEDARVFRQDRGAGLQYTYWARVTSSAIPDFVPVELMLHLSDAEKVVPNRGHFFHQYTEILDGGPVTVFWKDRRGETHSYTGNEGDSWLIPGFTPHWFISPDPNRLGKIIAITIGQHLTGDSRHELTVVGADRVHSHLGSFGDLLRAYRENRRLPIDVAARAAGLGPQQLQSLEAGQLEPDDPVIQRLASAYQVSPRDLMPQQDDLVNGVRILPMREAVQLELPYGQRISRVATSLLPNITANELRLNGRADPPFAFFASHTYLQVLRGPDVLVEWDVRDGTHERRLKTGDTVLIAAFVRYRVRAVPGQQPGRVLELAMAQHLLNGDAFRETLLVGPENLIRITEPVEYYVTRSAPAEAVSR